MPWLREQFRILQPKIVVCLGRIAAQRMIRADFSVTKEHGTFIEKGGIWFMGTFHPAALLRQKQNKPDAFADFLALREKIGQVCSHTCPNSWPCGRRSGRCANTLTDQRRKHNPPRFCIAL